MRRRSPSWPWPGGGCRGAWRAHAAASLGAGIVVGVLVARLVNPGRAMPVLFGHTAVVAVGTSFVRLPTTTKALPR